MASSLRHLLPGSLLLAAAALLPLAARAQVRVLFVGNSFTHGKFDPVRLYNASAVTDENYNQSGTRAENYSGPWGGIPGIFKKLADEAGLPYEVHLETISGQPLETHYKSSSALALIQQAGWNQVVLQDQSTYPIPDGHGGNRASFYTYATQLEQAIHKQNAQAQVYLYETWARADLSYTNTSATAPYKYYGLPVDSMFQSLHNSYYAEYRVNGHFAGVAPAGDAWRRAITQQLALRNPYDSDEAKTYPARFDLWGSEHYHPSNWGSYLNALVLFSTLTGTDPRTLGASEQAAADLGITPAQATTLQQVAYEQVSGAPLPVQLTAFTAQPAGPGRVQLSWQTASEVNSDQFVVERSPDGQRFEPLGQVAAAGSSTRVRRYAFTDAAAPAGTCYYRLRQLDLDGRVAYSPVRALLLGGQLVLFPNPAPEQATLLSGAAPGTAVRVLDPLGRAVRTATVGAAGTAALAGLPAGLYVVQAGSAALRLTVQ